MDRRSVLKAMLGVPVVSETATGSFEGWGLKDAHKKLRLQRPSPRCPKCGTDGAFAYPIFVEASPHIPEHMKWPCKMCHFAAVAPVLSVEGEGSLP